MDMETAETKPKQKTRSLQLYIGFFYTALALLNIVFFSVMILENQTDLLLVNFKYQSEDLAKTVLSQLEELRISKNKDENYKLLKDTLSSYELSSFDVFDSEGELWHRYLAVEGKEAESGQVSEETLKKAKDLSNRTSLFRLRYLVELNEKDFSLDILLPLKSKGAQSYLLSHLNIATIRDRLDAIYYQVVGAIIWGIIFHALFAVFVFRLIFRRIEILKAASNEMAEGELSARAEWKKDLKKGYDELDLLGLSFNSMAENIQSKVETISLLNQQIQEELSIGKEVQSLFLTPPKLIRHLNPALFYRPLREVSGDIYRYFRFRGGYYGVFFADASGHGVSAALITVITLLSLEEAIVNRTPPQKLMTYVNGIIAKRLDTTYYASGVFLLFDPKGKLYATNCGHNTVFVLPQNSEKFVEIKSDGPPLGLMDDSQYAMKQYPISKGDKVFVYSDGLIETEGENKEQFGLPRLFNSLNRMRSLGNGEIQEKLEAEFIDFARNYNDDVSFMILEMA